MTFSKTSDRTDTPRVVAPPPVIFLGALALGLMLHALRPFPLFGPSVAVRVLGGCLILGGLALSGTVMRHFSRAGTPVVPWQETRPARGDGPLSLQS